MEVYNALTILIGIGTICVGIWSVVTNRQIAKENAGKHRVIYGVEEVPVGKDDAKTLDNLNEKLSSEKYTILNTHQDIGNTKMYKYVLGRIVNEKK